MNVKEKRATSGNDQVMKNKDEVKVQVKIL